MVQNACELGDENRLLGTVAKIASPNRANQAKKAASTQDVAKVLIRFWLQDIARALLPDEKVAQCLRHLAPVNPEAGAKAYVFDKVEIHYNPVTNRAGYRNLIVCERLWICAVCAATISERRRLELSAAVEQSGLYTAMATFTLRHNKRTHLEKSLDGVLSSYRALKSGKAWQLFKQEYGWVGDVRSLEVTYGKHGWHPHIHAMMFFQDELSNTALAGMEKALKRRFKAILERSGHSATLRSGVTVRADDQYKKDYIAKYGRMPEIDLDSRGWTVAHEVAKANVKVAKTDKGRTPWQLLLDYGLGDKQAAKLFIEYAQVFKGRNQLVWSRGLRERLDMERIQDEMGAIENQQEFLTEIAKWLWLEICHAGLRGKLLQKIEEANGDVNAAFTWLFEILDSRLAMRQRIDEHSNKQ